MKNDCTGTNFSWPTTHFNSRGNGMADEAVTAACEETIAAFSGITLKKPKLSVKLLSKPPFRFVHDLVSAVTKTTGFAEGLFEGDELDAKGIKDKAGKIAYLQKIIDCCDICSGDTCDIRAAKVVAGLEPINTNQVCRFYRHS